LSLGYKNRYHHPHQQVLDRYDGAGAHILRTDIHGAVVFTWNSDGQLLVRPQRSVSAKPWF